MKTKIDKEVSSVYSHIQEIEKTQKQQLRVKKLLLLRKKNKIDFEATAKGLIDIRKDELIYKKNNKKNILILENFLNLVIHINEKRWMDGEYEDQLEPISLKIREAERRYGLKDGESFLTSSSPREITQLNKEYDDILDNRELEVFEAVISKSIRDFFETEFKALKKKQINDLNSIKSRMTKEKRQDKIPREIKLMNIYYADFIECYKGRRYLPAVIMLGSALESLLIFITKIHKEGLSKIDTLFTNGIIRSKNLHKLTLTDLIKLSSALNLMPSIEYKDKILLLDKMSENIKSARNIVHPGKLLDNKDFEVPEISKPDLDFLHNIFKLVKKVNISKLSVKAEKIS